MISSIDARLAYRNANAMFKTLGIAVKKNDLSPAYLRFETPINANQTSYQVPVTVIQQNGVTGVPAITEQRLELQDSFFVSHIGYFLQIDTIGGYTGFRDTLFTFPSTGMLSNIDLDYMNLFWDGFLKLTVNNLVICPQWDLKRHLHVPQTQRPIQSSNVYPWMFSDEFDGSQQGFYPVEPNWVLIGSRNTQMELNFPRPFDSTVIPGTATIKATIIVRGVLAQNSTPVR